MLARLKLRQPLPSHTKFTVESAMGELLVDLIGQFHPNRVLELGSGLSTLLIAYQLERDGSGTVDSIENEEEHANSVRHQIKVHQLDGVATVYHAPIRNQLVQWDGGAYPWYDLDRIPPGPYDFIFVDGPSGSTGTLARWPAYYLLKSRLALGARILLDDTNRNAERIAVANWQEYDPHLEAVKFPTARGATLLERNVFASDRSVSLQQVHGRK